MTASPDDATPPAPRRTNPWLIVLAVAVVAIPLAWGVSQTVLKSKPLFHHAAAKVASTRPTKGAKMPGPGSMSTTGPTTMHAAKSAKPAKHKK